MTVSARIHLRTRDLSANRPSTPKKKRKKKEKRRRRPLSFTVASRSRGELSREDIVIPGGTETATPGTHGTAGRYFTPVSLLCVRWTSRWHNSAPELSTSSVFLRDDFDNRSVCSPSGNWRDVAVRTPAPRSNRGNSERSRPLTFEGLICTWSGAPAGAPFNSLQTFQKNHRRGWPFGLPISWWLSESPSCDSQLLTRAHGLTIHFVLSLSHSRSLTEHSVPPPSLLLPPAPFRSPTVILSLPVRPPCPPTCAHATLAARSSRGEKYDYTLDPRAFCRFH